MSIDKRLNDSLIKLGEDLYKQAIDTATPSAVVCQELVDAIEQESSKNVTILLLQSTRIGLTMGKVVKACKRHHRTEGGEEWSKVLTTSQRLVKEWKAAADQESKHKKKKATVVNNSSGPPKTVSEYRARLVKHSKDLYKDPPVLPPMNLKVDPNSYGEPQRDNATGLLTFVAGAANSSIKELMKDFHPNRTPEEILRAGSFGGTYYRTIVSGVTNVRYTTKSVLADSVDPSWIEGLDAKAMLTAQTYNAKINKYGVKCGGSLGMWESSGWITELDPYGWFQWYCRFYQGRRCEDDARQISRWCKSAGPKGRFRSQLCNKILVANTTPTDVKISPVIRQTLLHWGLEITEDVLKKHRKRVGK